METIWIIGSGKFGLRAAKGMTDQGKAQKITLVDQDKAALDRAKGFGCEIVAADGIDFLTRHLKANTGPDWIVPAVPVHLAWEWCLNVCTELERIKVPHGLDRQLPNFMEGENGDVYASHADFICPPNCSEPDANCTVTGLPRKQPMHELFKELSFETFSSLIIKSHQLGPGVGGYKPESLFTLKNDLKQARGAVLVGTACKCHGVISAGIVRF